MSSHEYKPRLSSTIRAARVGQKLVLAKGDWVGIDSEGRLHRFSDGQFQAMFQPAEERLALPAPASRAEAKKLAQKRAKTSHRERAKAGAVNPEHSRRMREVRDRGFYQTTNAQVLLFMYRRHRPTTVQDIREGWDGADKYNKSISSRLYQLMNKKYVVKNSKGRYGSWSVTALGRLKAEEITTKLEGAKAA